MAIARMIHKKISISLQVNKLSIEEKLLFTWLIPHTDDEGKIKGDPAYVKALVTPYLDWTIIQTKEFLLSLHKIGLIYYWEVGSEWFIEVVKFFEHQQLRKDRIQKSLLPSYKKNSDNQQSTKLQPNVNQLSTQYNVIESNIVESNKSESTFNEKIAFQKSVINPKTYKPINECELAALEAHATLEPHNPLAFQTTYLWAAKSGLPTDLFYSYTSEIKQDATILNKGAIFITKVKEYLEKNK